MKVSAPPKSLLSGEVMSNQSNEKFKRIIPFKSQIKNFKCYSGLLADKENYI